MITTCVVIALAAAVASVTLTKSKLFAEPRELLRRGLRRRGGVGWQRTPGGEVWSLYSYRRRLRCLRCYRARKWSARAGDTLLGCPYCMAHWFAFVGAAIYQPRLVHCWAPLDVLVTAGAIVALAGVVAGALLRAFSFEEE